MNRILSTYRTFQSGDPALSFRKSWLDRPEHQEFQLMQLTHIGFWRRKQFLLIKSFKRARRRTVHFLRQRQSHSARVVPFLFGTRFP